MLKNLIKLLVSLSLINNVYADTTNNLVSQDFTTGWSGTNISTTHGSNIIAGVDSEYVVSDSVSLNDTGINKESLNEGFSVTGSADIWFWNNETHLRSYLILLPYFYAIFRPKQVWKKAEGRFLLFFSFLIRYRI